MPPRFWGMLTASSSGQQRQPNSEALTAQSGGQALIDKCGTSATSPPVDALAAYSQAARQSSEPSSTASSTSSAGNSERSPPAARKDPRVGARSGAQQAGADNREEAALASAVRGFAAFLILIWADAVSGDGSVLRRLLLPADPADWLWRVPFALNLVWILNVGPGGALGWTLTALMIGSFVAFLGMQLFGLVACQLAQTFGADRRSSSLPAIGTGTSVPWWRGAKNRLLGAGEQRTGWNRPPLLGVLAA